MKDRLRSAAPIFSTFAFRLPEMRLDCPKRRGVGVVERGVHGSAGSSAGDERIQARRRAGEQKKKSARGVSVSP